MTEYDALKIVEFLKTGDGPQSLFASGDLAKEMADMHAEARDMMTRLESAMGEFWEGDAAQQAKAGAGPLLAASVVSLVHLNAAHESLGGQGDHYTELKNKVGEGPGPRPDENFLSRHLPMLTNKDEEIADWNAKAQAVVQHYGTYAGQSTENGSSFPQDYGALALPEGDTEILAAEPSPGAPVSGFGDDSGKTPGRSVDRPGVTGGGEPGQDTGPRQPGVTTPKDPGTPDAPGSSPGTPVHTQAPDDRTTTSGTAPVTAGPGTSGWTPNPGPFTPPNIPAGNGFGPDGGAGAIGSRLNPGTPGVPGTGAAPGTPGGPAGNGGRPGAGRLAEPGLTRNAMPNAAGKPGAPGMSPGAFGRGGQKEEDKEHKRLEVLKEKDPDEIFGGYPDGMKPVPPTIGA